MLATERSTAVATYPLDRKQSSRIVEQAVRFHAPVRLVPRGIPGLRLEGMLVSATAKSVCVRLPGWQDSSPAALEAVECDGELSVAQAQYRFTTSVLSVTEGSEGCSVELEHPQEVRVVQRRRFVRAQVQESSPVRLSRQASGDRESWSTTASMMNLSVDGLACLADRAQVDAITVDDVVRVEFSVAGQSERFAVDATVKAKTPAATSGRIVVGLQLRMQNDPEQFARLQSALASLS